MANRNYLFLDPRFFENTCVLDREFDEPAANDNDYPVMSASPRDILPLSE